MHRSIPVIKTKISFRKPLSSCALASLVVHISIFGLIRTLPLSIKAHSNASSNNNEPIELNLSMPEDVPLPTQNISKVHEVQPTNSNAIAPALGVASEYKIPIKNKEVKAKSGNVSPKVAAPVSSTNQKLDHAQTPTVAAPASSKPKFNLFEPSWESKWGVGPMFMLPNSTKNKEQALQEKTQLSLRRELDQVAVKNGTGISGIIRATLHDVALNKDAPEIGEATYNVTLDSQGHVNDVQLVDVSSHWNEWNQLRQRFLHALQNKKILIPFSASKMVVRIKIQAQMLLPSGGGAPVSRLDQGLGFHFDVSDIGASKKRVVSTYVLGEWRY